MVVYLKGNNHSYLVIVPYYSNQVDELRLPFELEYQFEVLERLSQSMIWPIRNLNSWTLSIHVDVYDKPL